jgi:hypothetical protein
VIVVLAALAAALVIGSESAASVWAAPHAKTADAPLPAPVRCFRGAVNTEALDRLVNCFAPRGVVVDVGRRIPGRAAIRTWAANEVMGGRLTVIRRVAQPRNPNGLTLLVRYAPGGTGGFLAHYRFVMRNGLITLLDLTYP